MAKKTPAKKSAPKGSGKTLAEYLGSFPKPTQAILARIRATVRKALPDAEEVISYGVGAFKRGGTYVVYYAGYPKHVALYPVYKGETELGEALKPYTSGAATAKFPLDKPVPYDLITKIVKAKVAEHQDRLEKRAATSKGPAGKKARATLRKAIKKAAPKKVAVKGAENASTKAVRKAVRKSLKKAPAKAVKNSLDLQNLLWSLLKESVAAQGVGSQRQEAAKPTNHVAKKKPASKKAIKKAARKKS